MGPPVVTGLGYYLVGSSAIEVGRELTFAVVTSAWGATRDDLDKAADHWVRVFGHAASVPLNLAQVQVAQRLTALVKTLRGVSITAITHPETGRPAWTFPDANNQPKYYNSLAEAQSALKAVVAAANKAKKSSREKPHKDYKASYKNKDTHEMTQAQKDELKESFDKRMAAKARGDAEGQKLAAMEMGEKGAEIYMRDRLNVPTDKIIYKAPPDQKATQMTFDRVYEHNGVIYVVEAKGGGASLGVAKGTGPAEGKYVEQGTRQYLEQTIEHMKGKADTLDVGLKMEAALMTNRLKYMKVQVRVAQKDKKPDILKNLSFGEFQI